MKGYLIACAVAALATDSVAQIGYVSFSGAVISATCVVAVSGAAASNHATAITLPPVRASQASAVGDIYGKTAFTLGVSECSANPSLTPIVSITSHQAVGGYIASGVKNTVFELGTESTDNTHKTFTPVAVAQTLGTGATPYKAYGKTDFYIQYRAVSEAAESSDTSNLVPTITINLIYV